MKKRNIFLAVLSAGLILTASIGSAWAYFTTYVEAEGGYTISLGDETTVEEDFSAWMKSLVITSTEDSEPVYVRAKAFSGDAYPLTYSDGKAFNKEDPKDNHHDDGVWSDKNGSWMPNADGYYYYSKIIYGGGKTNELQVKIETVPSEVTEKEFNVVVIYETTPVQYKEDGKAFRPDEIDWDNAKLNVDRVEGGAE